LEKLEEMTRRRQDNHDLYERYLGDRFYIQRREAGSRAASISFGLLAEDEDHRRDIVKALDRHGVETRIFSAGNLGLHPFWYTRYGRVSFPMADRIHHCGLFLPNHPRLSPEDVAAISQVVLEVNPCRVS
jgi:CDP-6-deoxy-D-xylo-4-hexulose-3-dehydrase